MSQKPPQARKGERSLTANDRAPPSGGGRARARAEGPRCATVAGMSPPFPPPMRLRLLAPGLLLAALVIALLALVARTCL
jgi:hypothetical protein